MTRSGPAGPPAEQDGSAVFILCGEVFAGFRHEALCDLARELALDKVDVGVGQATSASDTGFCLTHLR